MRRIRHREASASLGSQNQLAQERVESGLKWQCKAEWDDTASPFEPRRVSRGLKLSLRMWPSSSSMGSQESVLSKTPAERDSYFRKREPAVVCTVERGWWLRGCEVTTPTQHDLNLTKAGAVGGNEGGTQGNPSGRSDWRMVNWLLGEEKKQEWKLGLMTLLPTSMGINSRAPNGFPASPCPKTHAAPSPPAICTARSSLQQFSSLLPGTSFSLCWVNILFCLFFLVLKIIKNFEFVAALVTIARTWKQLKGPSTNEWIERMWYLPSGILFRAIKKKETLPSVTT